MQPLSLGAIGRAVAAFVLGLLVGTLGTITHRSERPWGLVLAVGLVLAAAITMRAWSGVVALVGFSGGVFLSVQLLSQKGPGGDVLVPAGDSIGWLWVIGSLAALFVSFLLPGRMFSDTPLAPKRPRVAPEPEATAPPAIGTGGAAEPEGAPAPDASAPAEDAPGGDRAARPAPERP